MAKLQWLTTEYCGCASETVQPCLVDGVVLYVLYGNGYHYVFDTIYQLHLYWSGISSQYRYTCETEEELENYLKNINTK